MRTLTVTVGPDGRVEIPNTQPGQKVVIQVSDEPTPVAEEVMTLATARTPAERAAVLDEVERLADKLRAELGPTTERLSITHGDILYDDHGLPT